MNSGDVDGVLALFAEHVRFEDPVGTPPRVGKAALRAHLQDGVRNGVREMPGTPVAAMDDEHVVLPVVALMEAPDVPPGKRLRLSLVGVMRIGADELIHSMQVFWGRSDAEIVDG